MTSTRDGQFFLGKVFDMQAGKLTDELLQYDPADLTTHAVVTGMTGSGKTGMCIGLLEEAAIEGIPAIIIDPKGDLTNLLLHFPNLLPADFEPWIDPEIARREGKTTAQTAVETAENWKKGLESWDLGPTELNLLKDSVDFGVYTPGSSAGVPVNILSSFAAPGIPWEENREILREKISTIVTALLGLIGLNNIDPLRSREHILLSNILENAWSKEASLDLNELILQTQNPPFERLGAFPVNNFFPAKDRFDLAMLLNNFLASPSFEIWREGVPLDIAKLLYSPDGKPRHSIFYLAHLNDTERMFFVTLLFAAIESWMRTQRGTAALRALVYFDEILGYLPPVANPPSRPIMLRMLKQARAFGVGLLLATQNPVDVDYKGLSNAGTWFVGRLQTDQDKQRLLDGLEFSRRRSGPRQHRPINFQPWQAHLPAAQCARERTESFPNSLGTQLPGRPADPNSDPTINEVDPECSPDDGRGTGHAYWRHGCHARLTFRCPTHLYSAFSCNGLNHPPGNAGWYQ